MGISLQASFSATRANSTIAATDRIAMDAPFDGIGPGMIRHHHSLQGGIWGRSGTANYKSVVGA